MYYDNFRPIGSPNSSGIRDKLFFPPGFAIFSNIEQPSKDKTELN